MPAPRRCRRDEEGGGGVALAKPLAATTATGGPAARRRGRCCATAASAPQRMSQRGRPAVPLSALSTGENPSVNGAALMPPSFPPSPSGRPTSSAAAAPVLNRRARHPAPLAPPAGADSRRDGGGHVPTRPATHARRFPPALHASPWPRRSQPPSPPVTSNVAAGPPVPQHWGTMPWTGTALAAGAAAPALAHGWQSDASAAGLPPSPLLMWYRIAGWAVDTADGSRQSSASALFLATADEQSRGKAVDGHTPRPAQLPQPPPPQPQPADGDSSASRAVTTGESSGGTCRPPSAAAGGSATRWAATRPASTEGCMPRRPLYSPGRPTLRTVHIPVVVAGGAEDVGRHCRGEDGETVPEAVEG